jgi:hypothetical protein
MARLTLLSHKVVNGLIIILAKVNPVNNGMSKFDALVHRSKIELGLMGLLAGVGGFLIYMVLATHGPAICLNAATCG